MSTDGTRAGKNPESEEELRRLIAEHEAKLTEIADLVAHVRHEINNPLTGVLGQAQLLLRSELDDVARRRVETIEQLASRIRDTVARLRDVQRPPQPFDYDEASEQDAEKGSRFKVQGSELRLEARVLKHHGSSRHSEL